jgi:endonuclease YncB( thermonuclease family)
MRFASRLLTALLGLALIWYFWPFGGGSDEVVTAVSPPPAGRDGRLFTQPAAPSAPAPKAATPNLAAPKPVPDTAGHAVPVPQGAQPGEQTAALTADATPKPKLAPKLYYRVMVRDGGTLESASTVITLEGIEARAANAKCKDKTGRSWACGARARLALTRLIRGRAVTCAAPVSGAPKSLTARCSVGGKDLSAWMVDQGWAEAAAPAEPKLAKAADAARKKRIGLWR